MARKGPIIPTMRVKDEPLEHIHRRNNIRELERKVDETKTLQYNKEELYNVSINTYPMTMNQNREPMFYPCFFTPYKGNLNAEPYDEEQEAQGWKWDPYEEEDSTTSLDWAVETSEYFHDYISAHECEAERNGTGDLAFVDLNPCVFLLTSCETWVEWMLINVVTSPSFFPIRMSLDEFKGPNTVEWFARGIGFVRKSPLPHFMSLMVSDIDGDDDKITRGELLCILRIIERLLVTVKFVKHMITPVCVFPFSACYSSIQGKN